MSAGYWAEIKIITVVNGLISVYDHANYTSATYTYDKVITFPNKADYQMK